MTSRPVTLAAAQMQSAVGDPEANIGHAVECIGQAAASGAQIVVLPELFTVDYISFAKRDPALFSRAETVDGPTISRIRAAAREHGVWALPSIFERDIPGVCYDTAFLIDDQGEIVGRYRKTHIALMTSPQAGQEKYYFTAGNELPVFQTPFGVVGILICYDRGFPEAWRVLALQGAEIVLVPITTTDQDGFTEMARTRCFENGVVGVFANRCGTELDKWYFGGSLIADPTGKVLAQAGAEETVLTATFDLAELVEKRMKMPYLRDRRPDLYGPLVNRAGS